MSFKINKVIHSAQKIIERVGNHNSISYIKLLKLLYICDHHMLEKHGTTISGDTYYSMEKGPILSKVFELLKTTEQRASSNFTQKVETYREKWDSQFERRGYNIHLKQIEDSSNSLQENEEEVIDYILSVYGKYTGSQLVEIGHNVFTEWQKPRKDGPKYIRLSVECIKAEIKKFQDYNPTQETDESMIRLNNYIDSLL